MEVARRLHIYRNAYYMRLVEVLESDFTVLRKIVGGKVFASMMHDYLDAYPSHHFSVRAVGRHLAKFLKNTKSYDPCYAELAEFEWALNKALIVKDEAPLTMEMLTKINPDQWAQMRLLLHPSVQLLHCLYNTSERWVTVNSDEGDVPSVLLEQPMDHLVWQRAHEAYFFTITPEQHKLIRAIEHDEPFAELCESMLEHFTEDEVVPWVANTLQAWVNEGIFSGVIIENG